MSAIPFNKPGSKQKKENQKTEFIAGDNGNAHEQTQPSSGKETDAHDDLNIDFTTHVKAALGVAIVNIEEKVGRDAGTDTTIPEIYRDWISKLKGDEKGRDDEGIKIAQSSNRFRDILERVNKAFCVIIKTSKDCHPMMYFWLGYCHARGKNVIPITEINAKSQDTSEPDEAFSDLAFDIRALWHIIFDAKNPDQLEKALEETLYQMILNDYSEWSRKRFWDEILEKRGKVSIFTGALRNKDIGREMIGDWDLRAVSELTSYFASHQYRATIESPVYHHPGMDAPGRENEYIESLKNMLRDKNCVIIASPDVNPLTEIVLCQVYGVPRPKWFNGDSSYLAEEELNNAVVAFKEVKRVTENGGSVAKHELTFYREEEPKKLKGGKKVDDQGAEQLKRGFKTRFFTGLSNFRVEGDFIDQMSKEGKRFNVHAHLAVVPNPFSSPENRKYIVLLNGVSGPATFALTHVLTGGVSDQFVSYRSSEQHLFDSKSESEKILKSLLAKFINSRKEDHNKGIQCIINVEVGPAENKSALVFDWRHILSWKLSENTEQKPLEIGSFDITYEEREKPSL